MASWTPQARTVRLLGWAGLGTLVVLRLGLGLLDLTSAANMVVGSILIYLLPMVLTAVGAGALVVSTKGIERRFWFMLSAASGVLVCTESYWTWFVVVVDPRGPGMPALFQLYQSLAAALFFGLVATMTSFGRSPGVTRVRFYLDVLGAMIVVTVVMYRLWTLDLFAGAERGGWVVSAIASVYSVTGVALLAVAVMIGLGWKAFGLKSWERLVVVSLMLYGLGLMSFPGWYHSLLVAATALESSWYEIVLGSGYYLFFMAVVYRSTTRERVDRLESWRIPRLRRRWLPVLYPVVLSLALPVLGWMALEMGGQPQGIPITFATFVLAAVLILRSWLSALEGVHHRELAITDPVSGAHNHRYLHERLADDLARASTARRVMAIIVFDIDDFKSINNQHGHLVGDDVLRRVAEMLQSLCGRTAPVFRFGSDEFVAVVPDADAEVSIGLSRLAHERVTSAISLAGIPVSLSTGIALFPLHGVDGEQLLSRALAAQQLAKVAGADDVIVYDDRLVGAVDPYERLERARKRSHHATVRTLAAAVDARDSDTLHHSENVAELAAALAQVLGMSEQQIRVVTLASRLHDIGKIGVRDDVLLKTRPLSRGERAHIEEHPILGERILAPAQLDELLPAVRHHHERWDGAGYPDGLRGPQIPLEARVLTVCDSFEAMTSTRPYRNALSIEDALREIEDCAGTQFDPDVTAVFVRMVVQLHGYADREPVGSIEPAVPALSPVGT